MGEIERMSLLKRVARLSICDCGFPLFNEEIRIGTEYKVSLTVTKKAIFRCGGCGNEQLVNCAFSASLGTDSAGFMPLAIFNPISKGTQVDD